MPQFWCTHVLPVNAALPAASALGLRVCCFVRRAAGVSEHVGWRPSVGMHDRELSCNLASTLLWLP
jgi:hypothetical protein